MNLLHAQQLSGTIRPLVALNERVRQRLREEKATRRLSERDIAGLLDWSQTRVAYKLAGRTQINLDELEALCFALDMQPSEAVRDRGLEFCAEMTPTELRVLEQIRRLPKRYHDIVVAFLHATESEAVKRTALTRSPRVSKSPSRRTQT